MSSEMELQRCSGLKWADVKIMAQACVSLTCEPALAVEIRRGMVITSRERQEVGKVAGVAVGQDGRQAVCLILSHLPQETAYQSLPIGWIAAVEGDTIVLNVPWEQISDVPTWHPMSA